MSMRTLISVLNKTGENAIDVVVSSLKALLGEPSDSYGIATPTPCGEKEADASQSQCAKSKTAVGYTIPKTPAEDETQPAKLDNSMLVFAGRIYSPARTVSATGFVANKLRKDPFKAAEAFLDQVEGDFGFIITEPNRLIAGRDPMGVQPLYYGDNSSVAAIATNREALWAMDIEKPQSFPPGNLAFITCSGCKFKPVKTLVYVEPKPINMQEAAATLQKLLEGSVRKRVQGLKEVAVAFSGGLDSSVIAFLVKKLGIGVHLIHVSLKNQIEIETAKAAAEQLGLPLHVRLFGEDYIEKVVAKVVQIIEEPDPVKAAIGVPFYWTAETTAELGLKVLLAGQGADELFGGYQRYINDYLRHGEETVRKKMFDDVIRLPESNIERDVKICNCQNIELRLPFASYRIAEFAIRLPIELKLEKKTVSQRKLILRNVAKKMGLPPSITEKPKKAVQYSTGVNGALKKIAKNHKQTIREYIDTLFLRENDAAGEK
ncbi:MAG: asparagine synthase-related protein [Candidatus Bathyarchaeota archaeon]|nr:asparagine synthase-related protein [Candidatus Bathyarchaeota archaeon]